ncbi:MAG: AAA family ATPase [Deltaproteobacteria bacterium]|nr:AAA family ATPase [Deltaproteobacteria bacterium]
MDDKTLYLDYFGLSYNPFPVVPDFEKLFLSDHIDMMISELVHGIQARKGFMVVAGEIGLGKTTLSRKIVSILEEQNIETSLIFHTIYQNPELLQEIIRDFGLKSDSLQLSDLMQLLNQFLIDQTKQGKNCVIIIDDAQNLSIKNLELIRMISNLETNEQKLVQILLVGQPELLNKLDSPKLRQLKSRIIIMEEAHPLTREELKNYILFKLNTAGNQGKIVVTNGAYKKIYRYTGGNFRKINVLMDRCLYVAFLHNTTHLDKSVVDLAIKDLHSAEWKGGRPFVRYAVSLAVLMILIITGGVLYPDFISNLFNQKAETVASGKAITNIDPSEKDGGSATQRLSSSAARERDAATDSVPLKKRPGESPTSTLTTEEQAAETISVHQPSPQKPGTESPAVPGALSEFLTYYHLSAYEVAFYQAMKKNRFKDITDKIYEETQYQLILLDRLPTKIKDNYAVLNFISSISKKEIFCLFWKPSIKITKFYPSYRGKEIRELEELLIARNHYMYDPDETVGVHLMKAVSSFQKAHGLEITGHPDPETLFLLCQGG